MLAFQSVLQVVNALSGLLAVFSEALNFSAALHASRHLHAAIHLLGDLRQRGHVLTRVVAEVEAAGVQDLHSIEFCVTFFARFLFSNAKRLRVIIVLPRDTLAIVVAQVTLTKSVEVLTIVLRL